MKPEGFSPQALAEFDNLFPRILALVQERFELELKRRGAGLDRRQREIIEGCAGRFGDTIRALFSLGLFENIEAETGWLVSVLESRGLDRGWADLVLESWTIGIQGLVRPPLAEELSDVLIRARSSIPRIGQEATSPEKDPGKDVQKYIDLVLQGRRREAAEFVLSFLEAGTAPGKIADDLLLRSFHQIGRLWEKNQISASAEHLATEATRYVIYRLFEGRDDEGALPYRAFLACVPGDQHDLGLDLMAHLLRSGGWSLVHIGRGAPHQDILESASRSRPDIIVLSVSLMSLLPAARALIAGLKAAVPGVPILLGGAAALAAKRVLGPAVTGIPASLEEGWLMARDLVEHHA